jgi:hypothetical protein
MKKLFFKDEFLKASDVNLLREELSKYDTEFLNQKDKLLDLDSISIVKSLIFNKSFLETISKNLNMNNFIFLNKVKIQKNKREYSKTWHRDSGRTHQYKLISKKQNQYTKLGIYLQNNDKKIGGGVDIIKPLKYEFLNQYNIFSNFIRKLYYSFQIRFGDNFLDIKSGEIVGFSGLTFHQTTPVVPDSNIKLNDRLSLYFIIISEDLVREVILLHNKNNQSQLVTFEDNIEIKNLNNCVFRFCNSKITNILEKILSN